MNTNHTKGFWDNIFPREISFMKLPFYDDYRAKGYHARTTRGRWALDRIRADFETSLLRSDVYFDPSLPEEQREHVHRLLLQMEEGAYCFFEHRELTVYAPTASLSVALTDRFLERYQTDKPATTPRFFLLNARPSGFEVESVNFSKPAVLSNEDLELHYGREATGLESLILETLRTRTSGAVVLRGEPGTGKTSFIRHLIGKLQESHRFYYLPLSACRFLAGPDMVEFWVNQSRRSPSRGKVVVLEDAESLLMQRDVDNQEKVSSLLNAADGLLGEFLQLSIILTVNCQLDKLDPALTRPGRLLAYHEFRRLDREEASRLARAKDLQIAEQADYSLAEIYCSKAAFESPERKSIGFSV